MSFWRRTKPAALVITPTDAARVLSQVAVEQRAARIATTDRLRDDIAAGRVAELGWRA